MFGWNSGSYKYLELALTIRFIAVVHVTCHAMGPVKSAVLPLFHAFPGCGTVGEKGDLVYIDCIF